ncbi:MAG: AAA family ATPase [Deltaproteobacteria bacterium]|jgi:AAA15 family ATPase/GTPase|nr:AAA family ATPase [Deltaproteobacteria bacterium]
MITKLEIQNFRCLKEISIQGMKPITLISGESNVGKSSLLESIHLLTEINDPNIFSRLCMTRSLPFNFSPDWLWSHLFTNRNMNNSIVITRTDSQNNSETIEITQEDSFSFTSYIKDNPFDLPQFFIDNYFGNLPQALKVTYNTVMNGKDETQEAHYLLNEKYINIVPRLVIPKNFTNSLFYCSNLTYPPQIISKWYSHFVFTKSKQKFVELLQLLEPRIVDIYLLDVKNIISLYCKFDSKLDLEIMIPLAALGESINKFANLILNLYYKPGSILLVNEIENGLHYNFFPILWQILYEIINETKSQLIATTHSYDCIRALHTITKYHKEYDDQEDDDFELKEDLTDTMSDRISFIRLDNIKGTTFPKIFNEKNFHTALTQRFEIR